MFSSKGYYYRLQADWLPRYRVGPFAQETSVAPRWAAGLPLERIRWLPVVDHAGYLAELVIGQFVRRPGRHGRRNGEGHGHSIADGASDRRTTGFVQWCGALRPIIQLQLPDPIPCAPGLVDTTKIGGAWDEIPNASTSGPAGRWAHPAVQRWVGGAGELQKEASFPSDKIARDWENRSWLDVFG